MTTLREVTAAINEALEIVGQICDQERQGRPLPAKLAFYTSAVITELVVSRKKRSWPSDLHELLDRLMRRSEVVLT